MTSIEFVGLIAVPIGILLTSATVFTSVALATKKNRLETVKVLQLNDFGKNRFSNIANLCMMYFYRLFGDRIFSKRQFLTIPIYTLVISGIFFATWIIYLYIFKNPTYSLTASLPINFKQSVSDFYSKGVYASLVIDFITIQLTKVALRTGVKFGYFSIRFVGAFLITFVVAYFIFSLVVLGFRIDDMIDLYDKFAPNDQIPMLPYSPLSNMESSLSLFYPQTIIHVTSNGWFATYFMPEPLIFYCAVASQTSLLITTLAYQMASVLERVKNLCIGFIGQVGTPKTNAKSIIAIVIIFLISIPVILIALGVILFK